MSNYSPESVTSVRFCELTVEWVKPKLVSWRWRRLTERQDTAGPCGRQVEGWMDARTDGCCSCRIKRDGAGDIDDGDQWRQRPRPQRAVIRLQRQTLLLLQLPVWLWRVFYVISARFIAYPRWLMLPLIKVILFRLPRGSRYRPTCSLVCCCTVQCFTLLLISSDHWVEPARSTRMLDPRLNLKNSLNGIWPISLPYI